MRIKISYKQVLVPFLMVLLGTIIMALSVFLPYATATEQYSQTLAQSTNAIIDSNLGLTVDSVENVSLFEFASIYNADSYNIFGDGDGIIYFIIIAALGGFSLFGTLFALLKKATPIIVFTILSFLVFAFNNYDFTTRRIVPSASYTYGFGYYIFYLATVVTLVGAIMLIIKKHKIKKIAKSNLE